MVSPLLFVSLLGTAVAYALPSSLQARSITPLSQAQVNALIPYTRYASTGYCKPSATLAWNCGADCKANPGFKPVASGGDGNGVQYWFVGYDPALQTVIVSHQGTDPTKFLAILTDNNFKLKPLDATLFPGIPSTIQVHSGFQDTQAKTATTILAAVKTAMSKYSATKVTLVGHSLGAALSLLDSIYLPMNLPAGTTFQSYLYGLPHVGNAAFANYVDSHVSLTRVANKKDPIPITPLRIFGFVQPAGEVHVTEAGVWAACSGQENPDAQCTVGDVPNVLTGSIFDHLGPYHGFYMGTGC